MLQRVQLGHRTQRRRASSCVTAESLSSRFNGFNRYVQLI